ncbi:hypothetical protein C1Y11_12260 [Pseudomonas sp. FW305-20]|nr:hypothetical protein C1Y11_12260 [Pseudomonas sp. FW305-20]PMU40393.1 hypothetical protein C1Y12_10615 [Pseudomonas sp. FW305-47B]PMX60613.1 hypothetical protein C1Y13_14010 [Pseudomonas sp. FW305-33]PMX63189.1 hypothetical protein C1X12_23125 [Pseudomonas sp. FW305-60]
MSLLAIAVCQATKMLTDTPLSRAGSLLQGICVKPENNKPGTWPGLLCLRLHYFATEPAACSACRALRLFLMP